MKSRVSKISSGSFNISHILSFIIILTQPTYWRV